MFPCHIESDAGHAGPRAAVRKVYDVFGPRRMIYGNCSRGRWSHTDAASWILCRESQIKLYY
jgi:hypothetical protein